MTGSEFQIVFILDSVLTAENGGRSQSAIRCSHPLTLAEALSKLELAHKENLCAYADRTIVPATAIVNRDTELNLFRILEGG